MQGCKWNDGIVVIEFIRTQSGFLYNMEHEYNEYGRAFMSKYVSAENEWTLAPDDWFDMVINPFIRNFPILKVLTPNMNIHIWTTRANDKRLCCPELFSTVAYLEMKRVRNPRSEGRRIFKSLMDLPPLCDLMEASDNMASDQMASNNAQVNPQASNNRQMDDSSEVSVTTNTPRNIENSDPRRKHRIEMKINTHNDKDERIT
ncbi:uncharacterized protein TNCV_2827771 [Trichonephila clavipes]|nr:uncharacterized protein TNCV_2827771 [Trichonephila clavipes]